jgi:hypothetical protein
MSEFSSYSVREQTPKPISPSFAPSIAIQPSMQSRGEPTGPMRRILAAVRERGRLSQTGQPKTPRVGDGRTCNFVRLAGACCLLRSGWPSGQVGWRREWGCVAGGVRLASATAIPARLRLRALKSQKCRSLQTSVCENASPSVLLCLRDASRAIIFDRLMVLHKCQHLSLSTLPNMVESADQEVVLVSIQA